MQEMLAKVRRVCDPFGMTIFGYARVSTDGQTLDAQVSALKAAGAARVFRETASGAKTNRRELARALKSWQRRGRVMLTVLGGLAEFERELIRARTGEGRARAVKLYQRGEKRSMYPEAVEAGFLDDQNIKRPSDELLGSSAQACQQGK
jgi:DNA invertase Pin-like site-specific DNA recombinase